MQHYICLHAEKENNNEKTKIVKVANKHQNIVRVWVTQKILAEHLQMDSVKPWFKYLNKKKKKYIYIYI